MSLRPSVILLLAACARDPDPPGAGGSDGSAATTTTSTTSTTTSTTTVEPTSTTGSGDDPTTHGFIRPPDGGGKKECSIFEQDCPEGKKCAPYSADGDNSWDTVKCVDVVSDPAGLGEPCEVLGAPASGEDTCDEGFMCWYAKWPELEGTCLAHCKGSPAELLCGPDSYCDIDADGVLNLCLPTCDPLTQDCPNAQLCLPWYDGIWGCEYDASGDEGQAFDPCEYVNACEPGLLCVESELASECDPDAFGCCLPLCDLDLPNTCPGQGQQCVAWYAPGTAPPGYEQVGQCALP